MEFVSGIGLAERSSPEDGGEPICDNLGRAQHAIVDANIIELAVEVVGPGNVATAVAVGQRADAGKTAPF